MRKVCLRLREDLDRLGEVGARGDARIEPQARDAYAFLGARGGLVENQEEAGIRRVAEPRNGNVRNQRQARRSRSCLSREIVLELSMG